MSNEDQSNLEIKEEGENIWLWNSVCACCLVITADLQSLHLILREEYEKNCTSLPPLTMWRVWTNNIWAEGLCKAFNYFHGLLAHLQRWSQKHERFKMKARWNAEWAQGIQLLGRVARIPQRTCLITISLPWCWTTEVWGLLITVAHPSLSWSVCICAHF
jgi:hypothetical protein